MTTNILTLYAKAITHRPLLSSGTKEALSIPILPKVVCKKTVAIGQNHCNAYNKITDWRPSIAAIVHPNYAQTLSLPMQLSMMVDKAFPFSPLGIVHVANHIKVVSLPEQSDQLHLRTFFGKVYFHPKGWLFEVFTLASSATSVDMSSPQVKAISYYLAKAKHPSNLNVDGISEQPEWLAALKTLSTDQKWLDSRQQSLNFAGEIGRKYAKVSGDYNPIHLHPLTAKIFGFRKAIAHGMYSKALAISTIARQQHFYKRSFEVETLFMQAIELPTHATLKNYFSDNQTTNFQLSSIHRGKENIFLTGLIR